MVDPLRPFLELSRRVSRRYAAPFLVLALFAFSVARFGLAAIASEDLRTTLTMMAAFAGVVAVSATAYVLFFRPTLLLSDETMQLQMLLNWLREPDTDDRRMMSAERILPSLLGDQAAKRPGDDDEMESDE